jgi:hypothetical protein
MIVKVAMLLGLWYSLLQVLCIITFYALDSLSVPCISSLLMASVVNILGHHCTCTLLSLVSRITKRCCLMSISWVTNSGLVYEPKCGGQGGGGVAGSQHGGTWSNRTYVALALFSLLATCVVFF